MMIKKKKPEKIASEVGSEIEPLNDIPLEIDANSKESKSKKPLLDLNDKFVQISLGLIAIAVIILTVWGIGTLIIGNVSPMAATKVISTDIPEPQVFITPIFDVNTTETTVDRILDMQTTVIPVATEIIKERTEVIKYTVVAGDTIFGIADKFGLQPETVLWSNIYTLGDSPDGISIGVELIILPLDGLVYIWTETDGLNGVSGYFQVTPEDIINYPLN
ncbi:MAG: LysM peptidoglycan-binding domain-containing protein, partial [Anaerolineaceae bacterium]|nr:LysM peptidoglycan-binding domain-containing protein [Anaerolineaceae bacterium]